MKDRHLPFPGPAPSRRVTGVELDDVDLFAFLNIGQVRNVENDDVLVIQQLVHLLAAENVGHLVTRWIAKTAARVDGVAVGSSP